MGEVEPRLRNVERDLRTLLPVAIALHREEGRTDRQLVEQIIRIVIAVLRPVLLRGATIRRPEIRHGGDDSGPSQ